MDKKMPVGLESWVEDSKIFQRVKKLAFTREGIKGLERCAYLKLYNIFKMAHAAAVERWRLVHQEGQSLPAVKTALIQKFKDLAFGYVHLFDNICEQEVDPSAWDAIIEARLVALNEGDDKSGMRHLVQNSWLPNVMNQSTEQPPQSQSLPPPLDPTPTSPTPISSGSVVADTTSTIPLENKTSEKKKRRKKHKKKNKKNKKKNSNLTVENKLQNSFNFEKSEDFPSTHVVAQDDMLQSVQMGRDNQQECEQVLSIPLPLEGAPEQEQLFITIPHQDATTSPDSLLLGQKLANDENQVVIGVANDSQEKSEDCSTNQVAQKVGGGDETNNHALPESKEACTS